MDKSEAFENGQALIFINIWVAGDFNLPKMDWGHMCPSPDCRHPSFYRQITEVLNDSNLTQTVFISTRDSNSLDLFFTTNPTLVQRVSILQGISNLSKSCISLEQPPLWNCGLLHIGAVKKQSARSKENHHSFTFKSNLYSHLFNFSLYILVTPPFFISSFTNIPAAWRAYV